MKHRSQLLLEDSSLFGSGESVGSLFGELASIWGGVAKLAGNEMKRVLRSTTLVLQVNLNPMLKTKKDYDQMFAKHNDDIGKINKKTNDIMKELCKGDVCGDAEIMMFLINPAAYMVMSARERVGDITPESIDKFYSETGLDTVPIVGKLTRGLSKKALQAGQFATLTAPQYGKDSGGGSEGGGGDVTRPGMPNLNLFDRLFGIFLLQNPLRANPTLENRRRAFNLLLEQDEEEVKEEQEEAGDESKEFEQLLIAVGINDEIQKQLGNEFVEVHGEFAEKLVAQITKDVVDAIAIANADGLDDYVKAISGAQSDQLKSIDVGSMVQEIDSSVNEILSSAEALNQFLKAGGKSLEDFGINAGKDLKEQDTPPEEDEPPSTAAAQEEKPPADLDLDSPATVPEEAKDNDALKKYLRQAIYDQNVAPERGKIFESLIDVFESAWTEVLYGADEDDLSELRGTPTGDRLYNIMETAKEELVSLYNQLNAIQ